MEPSVAIAGVMLALNLLVLIIMGVWVVGRIEKTTAVLGVQLSHLKASIDNLGEKHDGFDARLHIAETEIGVLKSEMESCVKSKKE